MYRNTSKRVRGCQSLPDVRVFVELTAASQIDELFDLNPTTGTSEQAAFVSEGGMSAPIRNRRRPRRSQLGCARR
jgi:hypothetical protein